MAYGVTGFGHGAGAGVTGRASATASVSLPNRGTSAGSNPTWSPSAFLEGGSAHTELIVLVLIEAALLLYLRHAFRRHHGG